MEAEMLEKDTSIVVLGVRVDIQAPDSEFQKERQALRAEMIPNLQRSRLIEKIERPEQYEVAVQAGRTMQAAINKATEFFKPKKQSIDGLKQVVLDAEKADCGEYQTEKVRLTKLVDTWDAAERQRLAEEQRLQLEQQRKDEEARRLADAIELERQGAPKEAVAAKLDEEAMPIAIVQQRAVPKVAGKTSRETWKAEVTDKKALIQAIADGAVSLEAVEVNESFLNKLASAYRAGLSIPGVKAVSSNSTSFRGK
jgi:hypothetical protein